MSHAPLHHPMVVPSARRWWGGRTVVIAAQNVVFPGIVVALLMIGATPTMLWAVAAVTAVGVAAYAAGRWMTRRAWSEVPGSWWRRDTAPTHPAIWATRFLGAFAVVWALIHTSVLLRTGTLPLTPTHPRTLAWGLVIGGLTVAIVFFLARRPDPVGWTLLIALVVSIVLVPAVWPAILPMAVVSLAALAVGRSCRRH